MPNYRKLDFCHRGRLMKRSLQLIGPISVAGAPQTYGCRMGSMARVERLISQLPQGSVRIG